MAVRLAGVKGGDAGLSSKRDAKQLADDEMGDRLRSAESGAVVYWAAWFGGSS